MWELCLLWHSDTAEFFFFLFFFKFNVNYIVFILLMVFLFFVLQEASHSLRVELKSFELFFFSSKKSWSCDKKA